jgi:hypothetical protein
MTRHVFQIGDHRPPLFDEFSVFVNFGETKR